MACSQHVSSCGPVDRWLSWSRCSWNHIAKASRIPSWITHSRTCVTSLEQRPSSSCNTENAYYADVTLGFSVVLFLDHFLPTSLWPVWDLFYYQKTFLVQHCTAKYMALYADWAQYLHIIEVYVQSCESLCELNVSSTQAAQSFSGIGLCAVLSISRTANRTVDLSYCRQIQASQWRHTQPAEGLLDG